MKTIDELNSITTEYEEVDIDTYFEPMDITEEQKEERKKAAEDLWWVLLLMFGLIKQSIEDGDLDYAFMYDTFKESYTDVVEKYSRIDDYTTTYVDKFVQNTLDTTWNHFNFDEDSYWLSNKRALGIAVNEANTILNYEDLQKAIDNGMNVKIWHTQKDNKVREEHRKLEGKKIGITEYFEVGDSFLQFPRDEVNCSNIKDIAGCRCYAKADFDPKYEQSKQNVVAKDGQYDTIKDAIKGFWKDNRGSTNYSHLSREEKYELFSPQWPTASLAEAISKFASPSVPILNAKKGKTIYRGEKYNIVYDNNFNYFRIEDPSIVGKRRYLLMDGTNPTNKFENGRNSGRKGPEYEIITHYKNGD